MARQRVARPSRPGQASGRRRPPARATTDLAEIAAFERQAADWWNPDGPFRPLHRLNPIRMQYICGRLQAHWGAGDFTRLRALDIGCGGGLVSESLAGLGLRVTAIDAGRTAIDAARAHMKMSGLAIDYRCATAEALAESEPARFDLVTALEVIEHVADPALLVASVARLLKPGGLAIFSTLNRTVKSFALGIVAAEYLLGWVARGTHDWRKFLTPAELAALLAAENLETCDTTGLVFQPMRGAFALSRHDLDVNYFLCAAK